MLPIIPLDNIPVPKGGTLFLDAGREYSLQKPKSLGGASWQKRGIGLDPLIRWHGARESHALYTRAGDPPSSLSDIKIIGDPWTYALAAGADLQATRVGFGGGAGLLFVQGPSGSVELIDCKQLDPTYNYVVKIGDNAGKWADTITLRRLTAMLGSLYMANVRADHVDHIALIGCNLSDTEQQTAPNVPKNAVVRIHHVNTAVIDHTNGVGDWNLGAYDAAKDIPDTILRNALAAQRVKLIRITGGSANCGTFTVNPGIDALEVSDFAISTRGSAIIYAPLAGMVVTEPTVASFTRGSLTSTSTHAPKPFGGDDAKAFEKWTLTDCPVRGK